MPKKVVSGVNDLATLHPDLAAQWHPTRNEGVVPSMILPGSATKYWWTCSQGHQWDASVGNRVKGRGCPYCSGRYVLTGVNDLLTLHPDVAAQWHPVKNGDVTPECVIAQSNTKYWWQCEHGHEWEATPNNRVNKARARGCPVCNGRRVTPGDNDLASKNPQLAAQWHADNTLSATQVTQSSTYDAKWVCSAGHTWNAVVYSRTAGNACQKCSSGQQASRAETEIATVLDQLGLEYQRHVRPFVNSRVELDFYIPSLKFAIEYNGCYWHAERPDRDSKYHQNKVLQAASAGITLYQVWSDDWVTRREVVIRGVAHRTATVDQLPQVLPDLDLRFTERVFARQTRVVDLDYADVKSFLDVHHIQGAKSGTVYLGLIDRHEDLRAVIVLNKTAASRIWSIERYASMGVVVGGFTKLLKYAETTISDVSQWVTFADLSISNGSMYLNTGFEVDKTLNPDYMYLVKGKRVHKFNYRLKRFRDDPDLVYIDGLSERELALLNNIPRIWDSGKIRFIKDVAR